MPIGPDFIRDMRPEEITEVDALTRAAFGGEDEVAHAPCPASFAALRLVSGAFRSQPVSQVHLETPDPLIALTALRKNL